MGNSRLLTIPSVAGCFVLAVVAGIGGAVWIVSAMTATQPTETPSSVTLHTLMAKLSNYQWRRSQHQLPVEMSEWKHTRVELINLLPRLSPEDGGLLAYGEITCLYNVLIDQAGDAELVIATIRALERIGDRQAIGHLKTLTGRIGIRTLPSERREEILAAAEQCISSLEALTLHDINQNTLLRGSAPAPAETPLLRPSIQNSVEETEKLLRASLHHPE